MLDEKFVGSQFNNNQDHMIKASVVFENTELIYNIYDVDKTKEIVFMGDCAS